MRDPPDVLLRATVTAAAHRWVALPQPGVQRVMPDHASDREQERLLRFPPGDAPELHAGHAGTTPYLKTGHLSGLAR